MSISDLDVGESVRNQWLDQGLSRQPSQFTPAAPRSVRKVHRATRPENCLIFSRNFVGHFVDFECFSRVILCLRRPGGRGSRRRVGEARPLLNSALNQSRNDLADTTRDQAAARDEFPGIDAEELWRGTPGDAPEDDRCLALMDRT